MQNSSLALQDGCCAIVFDVRNLSFLCVEGLIPVDPFYYSSVKRMRQFGRIRLESAVNGYSNQRRKFTVLTNAGQYGNSSVEYEVRKERDRPTAKDSSNLPHPFSILRAVFILNNLLLFPSEWRRCLFFGEWRKPPLTTLSCKSDYCIEHFLRI